jgi:succinate dehydrogenase (ubiquinone) cytochrome b560 subunit
MMAYLAVPSIDSTAIISTVADLPEAVKVAGKFTLAWPFVYHTANGIRHLVCELVLVQMIKGTE